jgi:hypothetical protein
MKTLIKVVKPIKYDIHFEYICPALCGNKHWLSLKECQEKYNVYHLHVLHSEQSKRSIGNWKQILGENCIGVEDYREIPNIISQIVIANVEKQTNNPQIISEKPIEVIL